MWPMFDPYFTSDTQPPPAPHHPKLSLKERKCKKCKNQSLRSVVMPDTGYPIALCRLCGAEHEL
jgi:hypothetical protein